MRTEFARGHIRRILATCVRLRRDLDQNEGSFSDNLGDLRRYQRVLVGYRKAAAVVPPAVGELGNNPRYANYARDHGRNPVDQLEQDRKDWPGGSMCGFVLWNNARIVDFSKVNPGAFMPGMGRPRLINHDAYDAWLDQYVIDRAARLVYLCMNGMQVQAATERGMKPSDLQRHADWLRAQSPEYVAKIIGRVALAVQGYDHIAPCLLADMHGALRRGEKCPECGYEAAA